MPVPVYDLAIIGGGVVGCALARDAAGRGLSVNLSEEGDLAGSESAAFPDILDGGLAHLDRLAFAAFRSELQERDRLRGAAPHIVRPLRMIMPDNGLLPPFVRRWALRTQQQAGLNHPFADAVTIPKGDRRLAVRGLREVLRRGSVVWTAAFDAARFTVLNAIDARARGARIETRTRCIATRRAEGYWHLLLEGPEGGRRHIAARAVVNAAEGSLRAVQEIFLPASQLPGTPWSERRLLMRRLFNHDDGYALRGRKGRFLFTMPVGNDFTMVGSASEFATGENESEAGERGMQALLAGLDRFLEGETTRDDVRFTHRRVRVSGQGKRRGSQEPLLHIEEAGGSVPVLAVAGFRAGQARQAAEIVLERLRPYLRTGEPWTAGAALPGGDFMPGRGADIVRALRAAYPFLSELHAERLVVAYGVRAAQILTGTRRAEDLGQDFGHDLTEAEVAYLMDEEWAFDAGDVLWRRSSLGLRFGLEAVERLDQWMVARRGKQQN